MDPAGKIIRRLGGAHIVAAITGTAYTAPYRWQAPREKGGSGGRIPQRHHAKLLAHARANGIRLSAEEFLVEEPVPLAPASPAAPTDVGAAAGVSVQPLTAPELPPEAGPTRSVD